MSGCINDNVFTEACSDPRQIWVNPLFSNVLLVIIIFMMLFYALFNYIYTSHEYLHGLSIVESVPMFRQSHNNVGGGIMVGQQYIPRDYENGPTYVDEAFVDNNERSSKLRRRRKRRQDRHNQKHNRDHYDDRDDRHHIHLQDNEESHGYHHHHSVKGDSDGDNTSRYSRKINTGHYVSIIDDDDDDNIDIRSPRMDILAMNNFVHGEEEEEDDNDGDYVTISDHVNDINPTTTPDDIEHTLLAEVKKTVVNSPLDTNLTSNDDDDDDMKLDNVKECTNNDGDDIVSVLKNAHKSGTYS